MSSPSITLVIPTHNRKNYLKQLLKQVCKPIDCFHLQIVVVNDGSTDGTNSMLLEEFPDVHVVTGTGNWWFTKSVNEGIKYADKFQPDYVLIFNDDLVLCENYFEQLCTDVKGLPSDSILGPATLSYQKPNKFVTSGFKSIGKVTFKLIQYRKAFSSIEASTLKGIYPSKVLPGRGMLIPYNIALKLNLFDEKFRQYHSDFDFCLRAAKKGFSSYITWNCLIYSHVEKTAAGSSFLKTSFANFLKGFVNPYSRIYLPDVIHFRYRHGVKILFPVSFVIFLIATFRSYFFKKKIN